MDSATRENVVEHLKRVVEPNSGKSVVAIGWVRHLELEGGILRIHYQIAPELANESVQEHVAEQTKLHCGRLDGVQSVEVSWSLVQQRATNTLPGVKHVIAVGAGKGGVGKSTVAAMLAVGMMRRGLKAGLLDADVYGPSLPKITGTEDAQPHGDEQGRIIPPEKDGLRVMSMGYFVPADQAIVWRGPMAQKYIKEFLDRGAWGELDYLIVDLPPGTGDIPLTLAQSIPLTGAVIVCTPQDVALLDAVKALRMYQKLGVEPLGFVENMSFFACPHCGERTDIFGHGGVAKAAEQFKVPLLGSIPININIRQHGDAGTPFQMFDALPEAARAAVEQIVEQVVSTVDQKDRQRKPLPQLRVTG